MKLAVLGTLAAHSIAVALAVATPPSSSAQSHAAATDDQATASHPDFAWVTLGTVGGPVSQLGRNQPANLLVNSSGAHLVDVGDGAATGMVASGAQYPALRTIWLSHIHFDHIGGLFAILGLRLQTRTTSPLSIYGPPGTKEIVAGLLRAMKPSARSGFGIPGEVSIEPGTNIRVFEIDDGARVELPGMTVTAASNTHYSFQPGSREDRTFRSLSFRFDLPNRSIVYTGDTGPSERVRDLAKGSNLLVTEVVDVATTMAILDRTAPNMPQIDRQNIAAHLARHHLTPEDIGVLAADAKVGKVVITHIAGDGSKDAVAGYVRRVNQSFSGTVIVANDLDRF